MGMGIKDDFDLSKSVGAEIIWCSKVDFPDGINPKR
jgi:hypothetical protein